MRRHRLIAATSVLLAVTTGCTGSPQTIPVHEEPNLTIALVYDPRAGAGHSHPATIAVDCMAAALRGLQLRGRDVVGAMGIFADHQGAPAFTERDVATLAPYLAAGLAKASSRDLVTFHFVQRDSTRAPLVTSGGIFVRNQHLYIVLANAKSSLSSVQYETIYEPDSRINPLLPIARFKFAVDFVPASERIPTGQAKQTDGWAGYLDEAKVVVIDLDRFERRVTTR